MFRVTTFLQTGDLFVSDLIDDYELALDIAETADCDGDHDGIVVTVAETGRVLYRLQPVRFDCGHSE